MRMFSLLRYKPKTLLSSFTHSRFAKFRADSKGGCFFDVFRKRFRDSVVYEVDLAVPNDLKAVGRSYGLFFVDGRWVKNERDRIQLGLTGRSLNGSVVFAKSCTIDLTTLIPRKLPKFKPDDMTIAEFCAFSYGVISGIESNIPLFDIITDSQIVKNSLTKHEENFYSRAEHEFLGTSSKALWFHKSPSGFGTVSWLPSNENVTADFLSRKHHLDLIEGGKDSQMLWNILRNDVRGFYHAYLALLLREHEKAGKNGAHVIMGMEYDWFVLKALSMIQNQSGIDHSVPINEARRSENAVQGQLLKWGSTAFRNVLVVPRGSGIVHQVNHEYFGCVVFDSNGLLYPGSVLGTHSLAIMIDGLGVAGWGVGGIEAEATMLRQPMSMVLPSFVGFKMIGKLRDGVTATDLVLTVTQMLMKHDVVGKFVEFYGQGMSHLSLADRATVANISAEYGATMSYFPIDHVTLDYLKLAGRSDTVSMIEDYLRANEMFVDYNEPQIARVYSSYLELELAEVEPWMSGP